MFDLEKLPWWVIVVALLAVAGGVYLIMYTDAGVGT